LQEFEGWMLNRGRSERWIKDCLRYIRSGLNLSVRNNITAHKSFLHFLEVEYDLDVVKWQHRLKVPKSRADNKIPREEDIMYTLASLKGSKYFYVYLLLLTSGIRLNEAVKIFSEFDEKKLIKRNNVNVYELRFLRSNKKSYVALWPDFLQFKRLENISVEYASFLARRRGLVRPKYFRKFVATRMLELDMDLYIVDFIQGRTPIQHIILFTNYVNMLYKATKQYSEKYVPWLHDFLIDGGILES